MSTSTIVTYASKASAVKGAKRKELDVTALNFFQDKDNRWYWVDSHEASLIGEYGVSHCPHCNTDLGNGVGQHLQDVNGVLIKHEKYQWECMACGEEFGPAIAKGSNRYTGKGVKIEKNRDEQNGIKRPSIGGKCRVVWDLCDEILERTGSAPTPKVIKEEIKKVDPEANLNNAVIEIYQWRKFNGISGRVKQG